MTTKQQNENWGGLNEETKREIWRIYHRLPWSKVRAETLEEIYGVGNLKSFIKKIEPGDTVIVVSGKMKDRVGVVLKVEENLDGEPTVSIEIPGYGVYVHSKDHFRIV